MSDDKPYQRVKSGEVARRREKAKEVLEAWRTKELDPGIPDGYRVLPAMVYTDGKKLVVCASPHDLSANEDDHNCDAMGCGSCSHVVGRCVANDCVTDDQCCACPDLAAVERELERFRSALRRLAEVGDATSKLPKPSDQPYACFHMVTLYADWVLCGGDPDAKELPSKDDLNKMRGLATRQKVKP